MTSLDDIEHLYDRLLGLSVSVYLMTDQHAAFSLTVRQKAQLVGAASVLSLQEDPMSQARAYEICSRLIEISVDYDDAIFKCADMIMSRIGNFPGRTLLRDKYFGDTVPDVPLSFSMERLAREVENSIENADRLTDFQYKLYNSLATHHFLSVSAPTSAGKSHILGLDLLRRLKSGKNECIVYVVPTRALVSEVVARIRSTLKEHYLDNIAVRTAPFLPTNHSSLEGIVFVLTQERLMTLLSTEKDRVPITLLIVDEAHEIQKGKRGIILQNSIELALSSSPGAKVFFASPLIKNPEYVLSLFARDLKTSHFTEEVSPVSQNVILISPIGGAPKKVKVELVKEREILSIGVAGIDFKFRDSQFLQVAQFAIYICRPTESVIVFANSAALAERTATYIADNVEAFDLNDEICDFLEFLGEEIHPEYPLIAALAKGVGFHYGDMPSIVRNGIERLFRDGHIRYLCCTGTLLQGVNLPAKHIVIQNPHLGSDPMGRADFRNLAGRAGRLLREFHGNIWCLHPGEWELQSYHGENLQEIHDAMSVVMSDGGVLIQAALSDGVAEAERDLADAAISRLYHEFTSIADVEILRTKYETNDNSAALAETFELISQLQVSLPKTILDAHRALRPDMLQDLYNLLIKYERIRDLCLLNPHEVGGKARMEKGLELIHESFSIDMSDTMRRWICGVAHDWVWGKSIGEMIKRRVDYIRSTERSDSTSQIIRDLLHVIEKEVRYNLVRFFAAFEDLLKLALIERGFRDDAEAVAPYHVFLEFGSSDPTTLGIMALGVSRFTAIKLASKLRWGGAREPEELLQVIKNANLNRLQLPKLCVRELKELLGID